MLTRISKRNGQVVKFDPDKIVKAISGANSETNEMNISDIIAVKDIVVNELNKCTNIVGVEAIQDTVEMELMGAGFKKTAKAYILYRQKRKERRDAAEGLMQSFNDLLFADANDMDLKRDNANINTDAPMGIMLKLGTESAKSYLNNHILNEKFRDMHVNDYVHIHDADFSLITFNCCQIDLAKLLKGGFNTGHGFLREPNSIRAAASLACIAIQSNQNDMFGGQSISTWDYSLAPYVEKSFQKHFKKYRNVMAYVSSADEADSIKSCSIEFRYGLNNDEIADRIRNLSVPVGKSILFAYRFAVKETEDETKQAMEAAIHNFNSLHSRAGSQVPFSSINFGTDTTPAGRLVIEKTLDAIYAGLGNGETSIFPISVFKIKSGVNFNPEDPNYDLFQYACRVSAKRLFPNFLNLDAPYNAQYYVEGNPNSEVAAMGCRTRTMGNVNGPEEASSRGNFAFTTINLPMLALEAKELAEKEPDYKIMTDKMRRVARMGYFWELYDKYIMLSKEYLEDRYEIIAKKHVYNFPFLMGQSVWMGSDKLKSTDEIREVLKHASISIGFCGLAECLVALIGKHHGEDREAQLLGIEIVQHLRYWTNKFAEDTHMNWSTFATPAESTAGSFLRACRKRFGVIKGVTDRDYFTNSMHVPVYYPIKVMDKIEIEAPYHAICNAGVISYIEMDGNPEKNPKAFEAVVRAMTKSNMHYYSINHPVDRDPVCGYTGIIESVCPHCHRREDGHYQFKLNREDLKKHAEA